MLICIFHTNDSRMSEQAYECARPIKIWNIYWRLYFFPYFNAWQTQFICLLLHWFAEIVSYFDVIQVQKEWKKSETFNIELNDWFINDYEIDTNFEAIGNAKSNQKAV